jgi:hypothetical protein
MHPRRGAAFDVSQHLGEVMRAILSATPAGVYACWYVSVHRLHFLFSTWVTGSSHQIGDDFAFAAPWKGLATMV